MYKYKIKEIFQIGICSFCESVLQENLLSEKEFIKSLDYFMNYEDSLSECLEDFSNEYTFDSKFADNACTEYDLNYNSKDKESTRTCILQAFDKTINELKTYDIGAFMHILLQTINK